MKPTILRILVLEDDEDNLALIKETLEGEGWKVDAFATYDDAFVCVEIRYDVVIADVLLYKSSYSGYDLLKESKRLHRSDVYTMAISGQDGADRYDGHEYADIYLQKPVSQERLVESIRNRPAKIPHEVMDQINRIQENQDHLICEVAEIQQRDKNMEKQLNERIDSKFEAHSKRFDRWMMVAIGWGTLLVGLLAIFN